MTDEIPQQPIQLDVDSILKSRLPKHYKWIPKSLVRWIERTIHQEDMNYLLRHNAGCRGADFCHGVLRDLNITYDVIGKENLPLNPRALFISNHPLGGLDGIILMDFMASVYGPKLHFIVNDLLMAIEPLSDVFLPINKHGAQSRASSEAIDEAFEGSDPILIFPAGLCSRMQKEGICDLRWQKTFVNKAIRYHRPLVPIHFSGTNSKSFYRTAKLREKSGLKFNLEMILLPREVFRKRGAHFTVTIGKTIYPEEIKGGKEAQQTADRLKNHIYSLAKPD